jgi:hypothetical protein
MLNKRIANFAEMVWSSARSVGANAPKICDDILRSVFPRTASEAEMEGADKMLRVGVIAAVKDVLKNSVGEPGQIDLNEAYPGLMPICEKLKSRTYYVPGRGEYVQVAELIEDAALLDDARKYMRQKGEECLSEADTLDQLYHALMEDVK